LSNFCASITRPTQSLSKWQHISLTDIFNESVSDELAYESAKNTQIAARKFSDGQLS